jgi:hypothetical protein
MSVLFVVDTARLTMVFVHVPFDHWAIVLNSNEYSMNDLEIQLNTNMSIDKFEYVTHVMFTLLSQKRRREKCT